MDSHRGRGIPYRPEIDGLRALAVIPVVLFHAGFQAFSGGFVGVDVFFVISGYLITAFLIKDLEAGRFSLLRFYERRARRILPALFVVVFVSCILAYLFMLPSELKRFAGSVMAVSTFSSNIYFWRQVNYFAPNAELQPLLHTWSLAVEEQYYIFFPIILMVVFSFRRHRALAIGLFASGALLSLGVSEWALQRHEGANFFLMPSRCWELLAGAMVAALHSWVPKSRQMASPGAGNLLSLIGVLFIAGSVFFYDQTILFPSFYTLLPVVGAALILAFGSKEGVAGRLLTFRGMVFVGLISYSFYLWHQPLLAFSRIVSVGELSATVRMSLVVLSLFVSVLTWRYVENPVRNRNVVSVGRLSLVSVSFAVTAMILATLTYTFNGHVGRFNASEVSRVDGVPGFIPKCMKNGRAILHGGGACHLGKNNEKPKFAIWGDSHAGALGAGFDEIARRRGMAGSLLFLSSCPPIPGIMVLSRTNNSVCPDFNKMALRLIVSSNDIETVVLLARWPLYVEGASYDNHLGGVEEKRTYRTETTSGEVLQDRQRRLNFFRDQLSLVVATLEKAGKHVVLVYPVPEFGWDVPDFAARPLRLSWSRHDRLVLPVLPVEVVKRRELPTLRMLDKVGNSYQVERVRPLQIFCWRGRCHSGGHGSLWYLDDDHLSRAGAVFLIEHSSMRGLFGSGKEGVYTASASPSKKSP